MSIDLHEDRSNAGVRIIGGDFEVKKLKREIRIFGQNALTDLNIKFEQTRPQEQLEQPLDQGTRNTVTVTDQIQKFVFPFSDDKNLTYFEAKFIRHDGRIIQTLNTELKEKEQAKQEYQKSCQTGRVGAIVTTKFKSDEYTIEMGNKPEGTKYIHVALKYFETLKTEYRYKERVFTMTVPRHKKRRYNPFYPDGEMDVEGEDEISDSSQWIDEIDVIEPHPDNSSADAYYQINRVEWDDQRWEVHNKDGEHVADGRKWTFYEINEGNPANETFYVDNGVVVDENGQRVRRDSKGFSVNGINGAIQPIKAPKTGRVKNDLEVQFHMRSNVAPAINIEYTDASESEAIVSVELSEENLREQLTNLANEPLQDLHQDNSMEYDSNNTPGSSVVSAQPMEYVFLVDCSGSMSGNFMENTKNTMTLIMNAIDVGSKVIFCRFGSRYVFHPGQDGQVAEDDDYEDYHPYYRRHRRPRRVPEMRDANWIVIKEDDDELDETIKNIISTFAANLGGTEILEPIADILNLRKEDGVYRNIIVLTDGAVSNTHEVLALVKNEAIRQEGYLRFFTIGIGSGASQSLCDGIANLGRGSSVYVLDKERIQTKATLILENASSPSIYLQSLALPTTLDRLGYAYQGALDMSVFGTKRIYLRLRSNNHVPVHKNLEEGVRNGSLFLNINRERIPMKYLKHNMQPWYNHEVKFAAFWAKQEINYLEDADLPNMDYDTRKRIQVETSIMGGTLCDHTAFVGVMDRVGQERQQQRLEIRHEGSNTSTIEISRNSGYMAAGGGAPFGRPPASGGIGGGYQPDRAMFSGAVPMMAAGGGRPPIAGGIGGVMSKGGTVGFGLRSNIMVTPRSRKPRSSKAMSKSMNLIPTIPPPCSRPSQTLSDSSSEETDNNPNYDKLMSLVKRNGLWPASEGKAVLGCLMKYNKNFDKIFEDFRSRIEAVDHILTLMVLAALEKYEMKNQIEWARISMKAKKKLSTTKIDADAEIKALTMIL